MKFCLSFLVVILFSVQGWTHARFLPGGNTPGRSNSAGLKTGPCGGIAKGDVVATFNSGQTIKLQWEETVNHPGYFEFYISSDGDQTFKLLKTVEDTKNSGGDLPHRYEADLELPVGLSCENCTLRMIQQMTEDPSNPRPYFSCSDIKISNLGLDTPTQDIDESKNSDEPGECH